jgi:hypothetical protein
VHDIFVSYKRGPDEHRVETLVGALRASGFNVWWDRDIPANAPWEETIRQAIEDATIVLVCWSESAVLSENVRSEARWAKERNKLLQVFVERCEPPLFFGEQQALMLLDDADLYGKKFEAVRDAAHKLIAQVGGQAVAPAEAEDKLAKTWRRNEPAASWEPSQFGFTLALVCLLFGAGALYALRDWILSPVEGMVAVVFLAWCLPVTSFVGAVVSYGWLVSDESKVRVIGNDLTACRYPLSVSDRASVRARDNRGARDQ